MEDEVTGTEEPAVYKWDTQYEPHNLPSIVGGKVYVSYCIDSIYSWDKGRIKIDTYDRSDSTSTDEIYIKLAEMDVSLDTPSYLSIDELKSRAVERLQSGINAVQAEAFKKVADLQERIDSLIQIEYKPVKGDNNE